MSTHEGLVRRFAQADLGLELFDGGADIFRMDIRKKARQEFFRIFPGAESNRVEAQGLDKDLRQVVLMIHEPVRRFTEKLSKRSVNIDRRLATVIGEDADSIWVERKTDSRKRHFLMGTDERQYFICQLPKPVSMVRQAHEVLRPSVVANAREKIVRQGEWFFIEPSKEERANLELMLTSKRVFVHTKMPIGPAYAGRVAKRQFGGNPHMVDELVVLGMPSTGPLIYVRGNVKHVDHETVRFPNWVKIARNTEPVDSSGIARMSGVSWVD